MELYENRQEPEKAVLIAVDTGEYDCEASLDELEELAKTAGAQVMGKLWQKRDKPDAALFLGSGRLEELAEFCESNEIDLVIADSELSPAQLRNIEKAVKVRVIDRTTLILDIFADRARSNEGKLQVELAQLRYSLPRLIGQGTKLSRLGGGIGTRGPGETKLETDRRHIRRRIKALEEELEALEKRRGLARARREKDGVETVVIVGYTNAGKSTLMNALTQAGVLAQDKLFATLDPTSRALTLPDGRRVMLIDTVGFIRRLPHHLVEAFKSTLEEAACAKVILNVCDASDSECAEHIEVTNELLDELGCTGKPVISVFNKCDLPEAKENFIPEQNSVMISALEEEGLDRLLEAIAKALPPTRARAKLLIPYSDGAAAAAFRKDSVINTEEYRADGLYLELIADAALVDRYQKYCV
ncbi:MAG: GTPase HflX [Clostridiaceae bacterium]|nr:GTPase HflX [Clostridiaceae bacterium]MDO4496083.1 GTPase HflX [Clostridiaceae bacterium]